MASGLQGFRDQQEEAVNDVHYSQERAASYDAHHAKSLRNRLTTWRERQCLREALSLGAPLGRLLDLPCGTGRFADALVGLDYNHLTIADNSPGMLARAVGAYEERLVADDKATTMPGELSSQAHASHVESSTSRFDARELSAFDIDLPDASVDFIACMRFFHHLAYAEDRERVLTEFRRVSSASSMVAITLWVDGNLGAWRRGRKAAAPLVRGFDRRRVINREQIEAEFAATGYNIVRHWDLWPGVTMWRQYLLQAP